MIVTYAGRITGRGTVVAVEGSRNEIETIRSGMLVHQGDNAWRVSAVERSRDMFTGNVVHVGLLLTPLDGSPRLPAEDHLYL